jgi:hypothetical protein
MIMVLSVAVHATESDYVHCVAFFLIPHLCYMAHPHGHRATSMAPMYCREVNCSQVTIPHHCATLRVPAGVGMGSGCLHGYRVISASPRASTLFVCGCCHPVIVLRSIVLSRKCKLFICPSFCKPSFYASILHVCRVTYDEKCFFADVWMFNSQYK